MFMQQRDNQMYDNEITNSTRKEIAINIVGICNAERFNDSETEVLASILLCKRCYRLGTDSIFYSTRYHIDITGVLEIFKRGMRLERSCIVGCDYPEVT